MHQHYDLDQSSMREEIAVGHARTVFRTGTTPDPVFWREQWWIVLVGGRDYEPVTDAHHHALLDHARDTLIRAAARPQELTGVGGTR